MHLVSIIKAIILGIVEGVTEFLPVSSTGHLIIAEHFIHLSADSHFVAAFEIVIQLGAILSIVVLFWQRLWPWATPAESRGRTWRLWLRVIVGIVPAVLIGFPLDKFITEHLFNPAVVSITLALYGAALIIVEAALKRRSGPRIEELSTMSLWLALAIGAFQALALIPGTSRSAATILGAMILGLGRVAAAEFSFFMAIPIMVAASGLTLVRQGLHFTKSEWALLGIGFIVAFASALLVVRAFMNYLKNRDFTPFGYYRIVVGIAVFALLVL